MRASRTRFVLSHAAIVPANRRRRRRQKRNRGRRSVRGRGEPAAAPFTSPPLPPPFTILSTPPPSLHLPQAEALLAPVPAEAAVVDVKPASSRYAYAEWEMRCAAKQPSSRSHAAKQPSAAKQPQPHSQASKPRHRHSHPHPFPFATTAARRSVFAHRRRYAMPSPFTRLPSHLSLSFPRSLSPLQWMPPEWFDSPYAFVMGVVTEAYRYVSCGVGFLAR